MTELTLCRSVLDAECISALAKAVPELGGLVLEHCELRGGSLDGLQALPCLGALSLRGCSGAAVGYAASLALFSRGLRRPLELAVDAATVGEMRTSMGELEAVMGQQSPLVRLVGLQAAGC